MRGPHRRNGLTDEQRVATPEARPGSRPTSATELLTIKSYRPAPSKKGNGWAAEGLRADAAFNRILDAVTRSELFRHSRHFILVR